MAASNLDVLLKAFQREIRLAYSQEGDGDSEAAILSELNQLIFELLGLNSSESEAIYGGADSVPDGSKIELRPKGVKKYKKNIEALKAYLQEKRTADNEHWFLEGAKGAKLLDDLALIEEVEFIAPSRANNLFSENRQKFNDFLKKWRVEYTDKDKSNRVTSYDIVWDQISDGIPREFRSNGAGALYEKLMSILSPQNPAFQTVLVWAPLPTTLAGMGKKYTTHIFESGYGASLNSDEATATLLALLLLNRGDTSAKMLDIVEGTEISKFFDTLAHTEKNKEFYIFTKPGWEGNDSTESRGDRVLFQFNSREVGKRYSAKKLYSDVEKQLQDRLNVAFNMTITTGQTNSLLCVFKLPLLQLPGDSNLSRTPLETPPVCVYAPRFWTEMITSTKETLRGANYASPARGTFEKALAIAKEPNNELPTYEYDFFP